MLYVENVILNLIFRGMDPKIVLHEAQYYGITPIGVFYLSFSIVFKSKFFGPPCMLIC